MINTNMRDYAYFTYGKPDEYAQVTLIKGEDGAPAAQGTIRMSIYTTNQSIQDNINYKGATFLGLTHDTNVSDKYVIEYQETLLKVLYVNSHGRYKQVFMAAL